MSDSPPLLVLDQITKEYPAPGGDPVRVLDKVDLTVRRGETLAVVGPSGTGKTTLLNIVGTLDRPTTGDVALNGKKLSSLSDDQLNVVRNTEIGFVFQFHHLLPYCSVLENVLVPTLAIDKNESTPEEEQRARHLLERVGLGQRIDYRPGLLSGGERQRVAVVRALINQPSLLLADEPTGSLDAATAGDLVDLLLEIHREQNLTLILVTHSLECAARMGQVHLLKEGRLQPRPPVA